MTGKAKFKPKAKKKAPKPKVKTIVRELRVCLLESERLELGSQMAEIQEQANLKELAKKESAAQYKADLESFTAELNRIAGLLRSGYEQRSVKCEETFDFKAGKITLKRLDTGEVIKERDMSTAEREQELGSILADSAGPGKPKAKPSTASEKAAKLDPGALTALKKRAVELFQETHRPSTAALQRRLSIAYTAAVQVMDSLEADGMIGPPVGNGPRKLLMDLEHVSVLADGTVVIASGRKGKPVTPKTE